MIISVKQLKKHVSTAIDDEVLADRLSALELLIRKTTNNNFQNRNIRFEVDISSPKLALDTPYLKPGDTIQISQSQFNDGLYVIVKAEDGVMTLDRPLFPEEKVLVTKVEYPMDVKMGVVNLMKWEIENRGKVGIASETISRHSVTYFNMDGDNSTLGYPKSLTGFLKPYMKARF